MAGGVMVGKWESGAGMAKKVWVQAQLTVRVCFEVEGVMPREGDPLYPSKAEEIGRAHV